MALDILSKKRESILIRHLVAMVTRDANPRGDANLRVSTAERVFMAGKERYGMSDDRGESTLEDRLRSLEEQLDALQSDLQSQRRQFRGPFGLPRPPSPREVLRFTDQYAIPTAVAILQAQIKLLELLQETIRLADRSDRAINQADSTRRQAQQTARDTLARIEQALGDLQGAISGNGVQAEERATQILEDIQQLNAELQESLDESPVDDGHEVDVDAELEAIKDEVDSNDTDSAEKG